MKIKLSKSQWEKMGKEAGWTKTASQYILDAQIIHSTDDQYGEIFIKVRQLNYTFRVEKGSQLSKDILYKINESKPQDANQISRILSQM